MAYIEFQDGESLSSIRAKINAGILEVEQAAANALGRANHTGTQAQSTIAGLETSLQNLNTAVQDAQTSLTAIESLIGEEAGDADSVLNTLREALVILQNFSEGSDVAQMITDAQEDATTALSLIVPEETAISSDSIDLQLDRARHTSTPYTPTGNVTISIPESGKVAGAKRRFRLVMDGVKTVSFVNNDTENTALSLVNINNNEVLTAGTYTFIAEYEAGGVIIYCPENLAFEYVDSTAPLLDAFTVSDVAETGANLNIRSNEPATIYYAVYPSADAAHTTGEILAGTGAVLFDDALTIGGIVEQIALAGLTELTGYKVHLYAEDESGNETTVYLSSTFTTTGVDSTGPVINSFSLASDNSYVDITFNEGVYGADDGASEVEATDLQITNFVAGGATAASITSITKTAGGALTGGETTIRVQLSYTGTPDGTETFEVQPVDGASIYDVNGNTMLSTATTGDIALNAPASALRLHLDASIDASVTTAGSNVSLWVDQEGNYNASQATGTKQPNHSTVNDAITFTSANQDHLIVGDIAEFEFQQEDDFTIVLKEVKTSATAGFLVSYKQADGSGNQGWAITLGSPSNLYFSMHDGTTQNVAQLTNFADGVAKDLILVNEAGVLKIYDATNTNVGTNGSTTISTINYTGLQLLIGHRHVSASSTFYYNGEIGQIKIYDKALSEAERATELGL